MPEFCQSPASSRGGRCTRNTGTSKEGTRPHPRPRPTEGSSGEGDRAALRLAGPPSAQLLTSRRREETGGWQCPQGLCTLRQREAARTRKTKPPAGHCCPAQPATVLPAALLSRGRWAGSAAAGPAAGAPLSHKASLSVCTRPPGLAGGGTAVRGAGPPCPEVGDPSLGGANRKVWARG